MLERLSLILFSLISKAVTHFSIEETSLRLYSSSWILRQSNPQYLFVLKHNTCCTLLDFLVVQDILITVLSQIALDMSPLLEVKNGVHDAADFIDAVSGRIANQER